MRSVQSERFDSLLTAAHRPLSPEFKTQLTRLSSQLKERLERGSASSFDFFNAAVTALSKLRGTAHAEVRMTCLLNCGHFLYNAGFPQGALRAAHELDVLAHQVRDKEWIRKARSLSGIVNADIGNVSQALICYTDALSVARELNDHKAQFLVLNNLGGAFIYSGLLREAIQCFQRLTVLDKSNPETRYLVRAAYSNLAQTYLRTEQYSLGIDAIEHYVALCDEPHDGDSALNRTIGEFAYVQLALAVGQIQLARARLESCVRFSRWGDSPRSLFLAAVAEGLYQVHAGDVAKGIAEPENALHGQTELDHARITCLTALVRALDEAGQPERALHYLHELLNDVRKKREAGISALMEVPVKADYSSQFGDSGVIEVLQRRAYRLQAVVAERENTLSRLEMLERLAVTADLREEESGEHGYRVGKLASLLADLLGWSREASLSLELAARLHDIGKIGVPERILLNSKQLKEAERHFIGAHTTVGAELLGKSNVPQLRIAEDVARSHHEWWDGSGYPSKLTGKRIPIHARIVALADVFDALTHGRPYSAAWSIDRALEEIRNRRGTQFDPDLTDLFLDLVARLRTEHKDLDAFLAKAALNSPFAQARNKIRTMLAEGHAHEREAEAAQLEALH